MTNAAPTILYVITDLEVGGVPLHLRRLAPAMRDRGYRPSVVSLAPPGPVTKMLQDDGIPVDSCQACCGWDLRVIPRLARRLGTQRPDIVHAILFHANLAARFALPAPIFQSHECSARFKPLRSTERGTSLSIAGRSLDAI